MNLLSAPLRPDSHPRLSAMVAKAVERSAQGMPALALVYPCDTLAIVAASQLASTRLARPVLVGPIDLIRRAADSAEVNISDLEMVATAALPSEAARKSTQLARQGDVSSLMKGSLHTDEFMAAIVSKDSGLRTGSRISHAFLFDLPRYHKLIALADCVVNISPDLRTKRDILANAIRLLQILGMAGPKVAIVAAVEVVNPAIPATVDAQSLVELAAQGAWPGAVVEGPFGFDNAISADAARIKNMSSTVAGDPDLLLMPDLNAGNMLYKSFTYIGGGECAGLVLGAKVPIVLTSRADSRQSRLASAALAVLASQAH